MKVADYVIQYLRDVGIKRVFVTYGAACGDLIDAFTRVDGIDYVAVMHEQAGSFAAEVCAKLEGLSACIATSGPGGINLLNGIADCYYDSTPCIFITGQINTQFLKTDPALRQVGFQENNIVAMARPITKFARRIQSKTEIKHFLERAVFHATDRRKGPVLLDIPMDIQKQDIDPKQLNGYMKPSPIFTFHDRLQAQIQSNNFLKDLKKAERPVLLIGGGCQGVGQRVRQLANYLEIPCVPTWNAIDIITSDYEFYRGRIGTYGTRGGNFTIQNSDLILAIGCRFSGRITGGNVSSFAREAKKYIVDVDRTLLGIQEVKGDVNIYCDAGQFVDYMNQQAHSMLLPPKTEWLKTTLDWLEKYTIAPLTSRKGLQEFTPYVFMKVLSLMCDKDDVIVSDCGGNVVVTYQAFETKWGQRLISSHGNSPMGFSFAGALGACFIGKRVICIIGDGGFNMNIQELQTMINYGLKPKVFILDNRSYGITRQFQDTHFEGRYEACGPKGYNPPSFWEIIEAYGIEAHFIRSYGTMELSMGYVLNSPKPIICIVNTPYYSNYSPRLIGFNPIEDLAPYLPRDEFRKNMIINPLEGWENNK